MSGYDTSFKKFFLLGGIVAVLIVAVFANMMRDYIAFSKVETEALKRFKRYRVVYEEDKYFPQIQIAGPQGTMVNLLDGEHYMVLNIWATWCAPCVKELPSLKRLNTILSPGKKWRVIAVSIDKPDDIEKVAAFTKKLNVKKIASYHDINRKLQRSIDIKGLPMTLILDKNGKILYQVYGDTIWYEANVVKLLRHIDLVR